jgi:hypothetical protein
MKEEFQRIFPKVKTQVYHDPAAGKILSPHAIRSIAWNCYGNLIATGEPFLIFRSDKHL